MLNPWDRGIKMTPKLRSAFALALAVLSISIVQRFTLFWVGGGGGGGGETIFIGEYCPWGYFLAVAYPGVLDW